MKNSYKTILVDGKRALEHRHLAEKHFGKIPIGFVVNHKNGLKHDNRIENLEIVTQSANIEHAWKSGLCKVPAYGVGMLRASENKCKGCGHEWINRVEKPKRCPRCGKWLIEKNVTATEQE